MKRVKYKHRLSSRANKARRPRKTRGHPPGQVKAKVFQNEAI